MKIEKFKVPDVSMNQLEQNSFIAQLYGIDMVLHSLGDSYSGDAHPIDHS